MLGNLYSTNTVCRHCCLCWFGSFVLVVCAGRLGWSFGFVFWGRWCGVGGRFGSCVPVGVLLGWVVARPMRSVRFGAASEWQNSAQISPEFK